MSGRIALVPIDTISYDGLGPRAIFDLHWVTGLHWRGCFFLLPDLLQKDAGNVVGIKQRGKANDRVTSWRWWCNLYWLVVWNSFYFSMCWEYLGIIPIDSYFSEGLNHQPVHDFGEGGPESLIHFGSTEDRPRDFWVTLWLCQNSHSMPFNNGHLCVVFPFNMVILYSYVNVYQRVNPIQSH